MTKRKVIIIICLLIIVLGGSVYLREQKESSTERVQEIYRYKALAESKIQEGATQEALEYIDKAFQEFTISEYNSSYQNIWDILMVLNKIPNSSYKLIDYLDVILITKGLDKDAEIYFLRKKAGLCILNVKYIEAVECIEEILELSEMPQQYYYRGKALVDLSIVANHLGAMETAVEILENIQLDTINELRQADLEIYRLLNLVKNRIELEEYDTALKDLGQIERYINQLPLEKRKEIACFSTLNKAKIYIGQGQIEEAEILLGELQVSNIWDSTQAYQTFQTEYVTALARLYTAQGDYDKAIENYKQILEQRFRGSSYGDYQNAINGIKEICLKKGDFESYYLYEEYWEKLGEKRKKGQAEMLYQYVDKKYELAQMKQVNNRVNIKNQIYLAILLGIILLLTKISLLPMGKRAYKQRKIKRFMKNNNYFLVYQPIVNPKTNQIMGLECLLRLDDKGKMVYPNILIPDIEETDMMEEIVLWEIQEITKNYSMIKGIEGYAKDFYVSLNISYKEIAHKEFIDILKKEAELLRERGIWLCLELTENTSIIDEQCVKEHIEELIRVGFLIAIDDFGVEYSNISLLDSFDFHKLKLDKHFIDNIEQSVVVQNVMKVINELSIELSIAVIVEGVEEEWQKEKIEKFASDNFSIQGYYYSKPLKIDEIKNYRVKE